MMEQIYYTQCPVGYGLGASNGFQIKRRSADYPLSGDFRHLSIRPFLPSTKTLAPSALRYRRDGDVAEIAWLSPRTHEYQTERGRLWGRPGGQFAHNVRLDPDELAAIHHWPCSLLGHADWVVTDPEPTRGREPEPFRLTGSERFPTASFAEAAPLAARLSMTTLAILLASVATSVREGRTLFVIDRPDRLADLIALLTFAFPEPLRPALTFSTYHERPEELTGFRIQGTAPEARPNLSALQSLGTVVDVSNDSLPVPSADPIPRWASRIAEWFVKGNGDAWTRVCRDLAARIHFDRLDGRAWNDDWLNGLIAFDEAVSGDSAESGSGSSWRRFGHLTDWAASSGVGALWSEARGPNWWLGVEPDRPSVGAWKALHDLLRSPASWPDSPDAAADWGQAAARHIPLDSAGAADELTDMIQTAPKRLWVPFLRALTRSLPTPDDASILLNAMADSRRLPAALLLPSRACETVAALRDRNDPTPLVSLLSQSFPLQRGLGVVLSAIAEECHADPETSYRCASILAGELPCLAPEKRAEVLSWMFSLGDSADPWLRAWAARLFLDEEYVAFAEEVRGARPEGWVVRLLLNTAANPELDGNRFIWAVERILLRLPASIRPHDSTWAGRYLDRERSGMTLMKKLYKPLRDDFTLKQWIYLARDAGELSAKQLDRIRGLQKFVKSLMAFDDSSIFIEVPDAEPSERGPFLDEMLRCPGGGSRQGVRLCLEAAFVRWPGAFDPGVAGLPGLASAVARAIPLEPGAEPSRWLDRIHEDVIAPLHLNDDDQNPWSPDGFLAELLAAVCAIAPSNDAWALRNAIFRDEQAWKALLVDVRWSLAGNDWQTIDLARRSWDQEISKGMHTREFFELLLNAAPSSALLVIAASHAQELSRLDRLSWWDRPSERAETRDARDRFARHVVIASPPSGTLSFIQSWLRRSFEPRDFKDSSREDQLYSKHDPHPYLSPLGSARWRCIEALPMLRHAASETERWEVVGKWKPGEPPLRELPEDDRYTFIAQAISALDGSPALHHNDFASFVEFLKDARIVDLNRVNNWQAEWRDPVNPVPTDGMLRLELVSSLRRALAVRV